MRNNLPLTINYKEYSIIWLWSNILSFNVFQVIHKYDKLWASCPRVMLTGHKWERYKKVFLELEGCL